MLRLGGRAVATHVPIRCDVIDSGVDRIWSAVELLRDRPARRYSLADAVSFVVMRDFGIEQAFTLDTDFAAEGFRMLPGEF